MNRDNRRKSRSRRAKAIHKIRLGFVYAAIALSLVLICTISYKAMNTKANTGYKYYTDIKVQYNDSLWSIAEEYADLEQYKNYRNYINEVMHINNILDENNIYVGQTLIIPYYSSEYLY